MPNWDTEIIHLEQTAELRNEEPPSRDEERVSRGVAQVLVVVGIKVSWATHEGREWGGFGGGNVPHDFSEV